MLNRLLTQFKSPSFLFSNRLFRNHETIFHSPSSMFYLNQSLLSSSSYIPSSSSSSSSFSSSPQNDNSSSFRFPLSYGIGCSAGLTGTLLGVGGGLVTTPLLQAVAKVPPHAASATSQATIIFTASSAACYYLYKSTQDADFSDLLQSMNHLFDLRSAFWISLSGAAMSPLVTRYISKVSSDKLRIALGLFMLCFVGPLVALKEYLRNSTTSSSTSSSSSSDSSSSTSSNSNSTPSYNDSYSTVNSTSSSLSLNHLSSNNNTLPIPVLVLVGVLVAVAGAAFGIGGGLIMTPLLSLSCDYERAVMTSLLSMVPPAVTGSIQSYKMGNVRVRLLPGLLTGAVCGSLLGAEILLRLDESTQRQLFAIIIGSLGIIQMIKK